MGPGSPHRAMNLSLRSSASRPGSPNELKWWRIQPLPSDRPTPYWVMQVPGEIIQGHAPIFTPEGRALMAALFRITNPKSEPGPRQMRLEQTAP